MKTISVRDVAQALDISPRAVLYRREKGQLKGVLVKNDHGVAEYRIYPNKEIIEALKRNGSPLLSGNDAVQEADIVVEASDAQSSFEPFDPSEDAIIAEGSVKSEAGAADTRATADGVAQELWNSLISRFLGRLEEKDQLIGEMRVEIEDKDRRLKLLPDLQKKAEEAEQERLRAEEEREKTQLKALEAEALKKQIAALEERIEKTPEVISQLEEEKQAKEEYKRIADDAQKRLDDLQKSLEERDRKEESKEAELTELRRIQQEKDAAIRQEVAALSAKLENAQKPWWSKLFG